MEKESSYAKIWLSNQNNDCTEVPNFLHQLLIHKYHASNTLQIAKYHEMFEEYKTM